MNLRLLILPQMNKLPGMFLLEAGSTLFAGASFYFDWGTSNPVTKNIVRGVQAFSVASGVDRLARLSLPTNAKAAPALLITGLISAVLEELAYAGVLTSQSFPLLPLRMGISFLVGNSATQNFKISLLFVVARESIVRLLPAKFSKPLLVTVDTTFFTLIELKQTPPEGRAYKALSSFFFRAIANATAYETGVGASLTQHVLFNLSRSDVALK